MFVVRRSEQGLEEIGDAYNGKGMGYTYVQETTEDLDCFTHDKDQNLENGMTAAKRWTFVLT